MKKTYVNYKAKIVAEQWNNHGDVGIVAKFKGSKEEEIKPCTDCKKLMKIHGFIGITPICPGDYVIDRNGAVPGIMKKACFENNYEEYKQ